MHVFAEIRAATARELKTVVREHEADAAVPFTELQFMYLRHTAVTRLAEAGCTPQDIAGVTGHSLQAIDQIIDIYLVRTAKLARCRSLPPALKLSAWIVFLIWHSSRPKRDYAVTTNMYMCPT